MMTPAPAAHAQSRDREPLVRVLNAFDGGARVGVTVHEAGKDDKAGGVIVDEVEPDSPAAKAGVTHGDAIVEFDGERVRSVRQFRRLVQETPEDRSVQTVLVRGGQRTTVSLTPERRSWDGDFDYARPPMPPMTPRPPEPPSAMVRPFLTPDMRGFESFASRDEGRLGVSVETLTDQLGDYFGAKEGVLVRSVRDDSPAAAAGIHAGDVIVAVNGRHVDDPSDVSREIGRGESTSVTLDIVRDRKSQTVKVTLPDRETRSRTRTIL
jgi:S1-C subfamily serine protease